MGDESVLCGERIIVPPLLYNSSLCFFISFFFRVGNAFRKSLFLPRNFSLSSSFDLPPVSGKSRGGGGEDD